MAPEFSREREIFLEALECHSTTARGHYLDSACGSDLSLRQLVESLLRHHRTHATTPVLHRAYRPEVSDGEVYAPGTQMDRYRLVRRIGHGGCGIVYLAEQESPVRRQVALKVLKPRGDNRAVIARFGVERQVLALMDHPNIARLFDAGETSSGHPYFVMEWVRGDPLTRYCDLHQLSLNVRLELFIQVCRAVEHAHQKGIVHRDLKPSNILVTELDGRPVPKVIDFGIAKAIDPGGDVEMESHPGASWLGTPAYMSPEQRKNGPVDSRSDVYSLGVVLFELLTGTTPESGVPGVARPPDPRREGLDPRSPFARLAQLSEDRLILQARAMNTDRRRLIRSVGGDLDLITIHSLAAELGQRYASVGDLILDLRSLLAHQPISVRKKSTVYRAAKYLRRHRWGVGLSLGLVGGLSALGGLFAWHDWVTHRVLQRAEFAERQQQVERERLMQARAQEQQLRVAAATQTASTLQQAYRADINLAQAALAANNLGRAVSLLQPYAVAPGLQDLRNWEWRYLWYQCRSDAVRTLGILSNEVVQIAVSRDARWIAARSQAGEIKVWNPSREGPAETLDANRGDQGLAIGSTPDGAILARSWSGPHPPGANQYGIELRLLDRADSPPRILPAESPVTSLWFSPDAQALVGADSQGNLVRWEVASGVSRPLITLGKSRRFAPTPALSADQLLVAQATEGGGFRVMEAATGRERFAGKLPSGTVRSLRFSPNDRYLAVIGDLQNSTLAIWNVDSGREEGFLEGHSAWIGGAVFLPDNQTLASVSADQTIRLWDVRTRQQIGVLRGHRLEVWSVAVSDDGRYLVSGAKDGVVNLWDLDRPLRESEPWISGEETQAWVFPSGEGGLVTLGRDGRVRRRHFDRLEMPEDILNVGTAPRTSVFSADGKRLAVGRPDGGVELWTLTPPALHGTELPASRPALPVAFVGGGNRLVTWHPNERRFRAWDDEGRVCWMEWPGRTNGFPWDFGPIAAGQDSLATLDSMDEVGLRNFASGGNRKYPSSRLSVSGLALSADGGWLALTSRNGITRLWNTRSNGTSTDITGFLLGTHGVAFTPDGSRLAVTSSGHEAIKLFSTSSGQEVLTLGSNDVFLRSPSFSPDGEWLGAADRVGHLRLWRAPLPEARPVPLQ